MADQDVPRRTSMKSKFRTRDFKEKKQRREKIAMLTAYDANMARLLDRAGVDAILVGDSVGMVVLGFDTTVPVTLDAMIHHTAAVSRGTERALIVADMPFLTYETTTADAVRNAGRLMQEGGAEAVKVEGGSAILDAVKRLVDVGIPVMGHLGLLPQSVHRVGGFLRQATTPRDADILLADALALEEAGVFAIVLEAIPSDVARTVTEALSIATIGIGAGPDCDGQVLVTNDMVGLFDGPVPSFVKQYAHLAEEVTASVQAYVEDVKSGRYARTARTPAAKCD
ncbi:MAG TPA: 3-methyl-2-oxobutanoate hydroxymethyltransferase [Vicinamibacterales bacterium]